MLLRVRVRVVGVEICIPTFGNVTVWQCNVTVWQSCQLSSCRVWSASVRPSLVAFVDVLPGGGLTARWGSEYTLSHILLCNV